MEFMLGILTVVIGCGLYCIAEALMKIYNKLDDIKILLELKKKYTAQNTNNFDSRQTIEENKKKYTESEDTK